jgi:DNA helicase HerA-like ATPase
LIRSKGVGVFFVSQNPLDIPDLVLGQLGNRVQHALRAFTPRDQKAVRAAAETFRVNPELDTEKALTELGVGEALVSFLEEKGPPGIVQRAFVLPPHSQIGPITPPVRQQIIAQSLVAGAYEKLVDRESAYEMLKQRAAQPANPPPAAQSPQAAEPARKPTPRTRQEPTLTSEAGNLVGSLAKSTARAMGTQVGRELVRGVLGSLLGGTSTTSRRRR